MNHDRARMFPMAIDSLDSMNCVIKIFRMGLN